MTDLEYESLVEEVKENERKKQRLSAQNHLKWRTRAGVICAIVSTYIFLDAVIVGITTYNGFDYARFTAFHPWLFAFILAGFGVVWAFGGDS